MSENGRSEREAGDFLQPRRTAAGAGVLAIAAVISIVVAGSWVLDPDARPGSKAIPSPPAVPSASREFGVAEDERTVYLWDTASGDMRDLVTGPALSDPDLSPNGELLVYEREEVDGASQIYLLDADGTEHRLTNFPGGAIDPSWSPDGQIAFAATPTDVVGPGASTDIFVMEADGSDIRRLAGTVYDDADPDWSPDGSRIAFDHTSADGPGMIWVASTETRSNRRLTPLHETGSAMDPAWSPDGRWIAYTRYDPDNTSNGELDSSELWLMSPDGFERRRIGKIPLGSADHRTLGPTRSQPSWSPDGRLIVYERNDRNGTELGVDVINARTGLSRPFLSSTPGGWWVGFDPSWGSEGILYIRPSADPILEEPFIPAGFGTASGLGGPGVDATITITGAACRVDGRRTLIRSGDVTLELVNETSLEGHFEIARLRGSLDDLRGRRFVYLRDARVVSLDPMSTDLWSPRARIGPGRWAVRCYKGRAESGVVFTRPPVGVAGPLIVGSVDPAGASSTDQGGWNDA